MKSPRPAEATIIGIRVLGALVALAAAGSCAGTHPTTPTSEPDPSTVARAPGTVFRDALRSGGEGPEMSVIPAGWFRMGCLSNDRFCDSDEKPVRDVRIPRAFALSVHEVTFAHWDACVAGGGCGGRDPGDRGWGRGDRPVINVSWEDAQSYVMWLSRDTGESYHLPSEAEWEYAARAGSAAKYSWGNDIGDNRANCYDCGSRWDDEQTAPVGAFAPNRFGLYDMHGNVSELVEDCWHWSYAGAPSDGSAWRGGHGDCDELVVRGGSWGARPRNIRAAFRGNLDRDRRFDHIGFRVARTLRLTSPSLDGGMCADQGFLKEQLRVVEQKYGAFGDAINLLRQTRGALASYGNAAVAIGATYGILESEKLVLGHKLSACHAGSQWVFRLIWALGTPFGPHVRGEDASDLSLALVVGNIGGDTVGLAENTYALPDFVKRYADMNTDASALARDLDETVRRIEAARDVLLRQRRTILGQLSLGDTVPEPLCSGVSVEETCWRAVEARPGCHVWDSQPVPETSVAFRGVPQLRKRQAVRLGNG